MEWIILLTLNWIVFLFLVDWKEIKRNIWSGLLAITMAINVDYCNISFKRYVFHRPIITFLKSSIFFLFGPVLIIGILFAQYHPKKRWLTILNVLVVFTLYSFTELILVERGAIEYLKWKFYDSILVNIGAITILSWFSIVVLNKWGVDK